MTGHDQSGSSWGERMDLFDSLFHPSLKYDFYSRFYGANPTSIVHRKSVNQFCDAFTYIYGKWGAEAIRSAIVRRYTEYVKIQAE